MKVATHPILTTYEMLQFMPGPERPEWITTDTIELLRKQLAKKEHELEKQKEYYEEVIKDIHQFRKKEIFILFWGITIIISGIIAIGLFSLC